MIWTGYPEIVQAVLLVKIGKNIYKYKASGLEQEGNTITVPFY